MIANPTTISDHLANRAAALLAEAKALGLTVTEWQDGTRTVAGQPEAMALWRRALALGIAAETLKEVGL